MLRKLSPCKVNLILNILGKRPDGFHELETVMHPVSVHDELEFATSNTPNIQLTCNVPELPVDARNLVYRAAQSFLSAANLTDGLRIHLEKKLPLAAGLGGGSANAAITLLTLNELFQQPLPPQRLVSLAAALGSDVPFFLQSRPALALGRGEQVQSLDFFPALRNRSFLLIHPGFGISTAWAYQSLSRFPQARDGRPGRAQELVSHLQKGSLADAKAHFYNSLEAPALEKYPILKLFQEFLLENGAEATLMSGSGSTTFALAPTAQIPALTERFLAHFGRSNWTAAAPACPPAA